MKHHVFTYGSLMFPAVWQRVVAGRYRSTAAALADHARFTVADETYPGMLAAGGAHVVGVLYFDVEAPDLLALDDFEGGDYQRNSVQVEDAAGLRWTAETYVFLPVQKLLAQTWSPENFSLEQFLKRYCHDKLP